MKSNLPKIALLISILFFIFSVSIFLFFYREINNKNQKSQSMEIEWQREASRRDEIKALDRSINVIESERAQLETHFAKSSDVVPFLDTIEGLALKADSLAEVVSVSILEDQTALIVGMRASGDFVGLYKFLTLLENSPYELEFNSIDIQRETGVGAGTSNLPKWNMSFKLKLLSFIP